MAPGELAAGPSRARRLMAAARAVKRSIDLVGAAVLLVLSLPFQAAAALAVVLDDGPPAYFRQPRAGRGGRRFEVLKLRTMRTNDVPPDELGQVGSGHPLVTRSGRILRRFKLDELPQLLSVLRGDMSLVGPRPTLPEQAERYDDFERRRLAVRPGITGWAQVHGNVQLSWTERILLDVWYVDHWSLRLDAVVLARTFAVVVGGERVDPEALETARAHAERSRRRG